MTSTEVGLVVIVVAITLTALNRLPRTRAIALFVAICSVGLGGRGGSMIAEGAGEAARLAGSALSALFGPAAAAIGGGVIAIAAAIFAIVRLHEKHGGRVVTFAAVLAAVMCVAGVTGVRALNNLPHSVQQGVTSTQTATRAAAHPGGRSHDHHTAPPAGRLSAHPGRG